METTMIIGIIFAVSLLGALISFVIAAKLIIDCYRETMETARHVNNLVNEYTSRLSNIMTLFQQYNDLENQVKNISETFEGLSGHIVTGFNQAGNDIGDIRERLEILERKNKHFGAN